MNNKDYHKTIKRLLKLSSMINEKFEILAELSYRDRENTMQYDEQYNLLKDYVHRETIIINNLNLDDLKQIFNLLPKYDDNTDEYMRLHIYIDDLINNYLIKDEDNSDNYEEDIDEDIDSIDEEDKENITDNYYVSEEENEKYAGIVMDKIAIIVLKKMYDRINNTYADNKEDIKYKKRLLKELKSFKYWVFAIDTHLEKIGIDYRFNLDKLPLLNMPNIDMNNICYNDSVELIERMYNYHDVDYDPTDISEVLFNYMCFEEFIKVLNDEEIDKLIELCNELSSKSDNYYGNIVREKLIRKKQS